jgi:hypothetical protein
MNSCVSAGISGGCCEHGDEPSGSIKVGEFLDQVSAYLLIKQTAQRSVAAKVNSDYRNTCPCTPCLVPLDQTAPKLPYGYFVVF